MFLSITVLLDVLNKYMYFSIDQAKQCDQLILRINLLKSETILT